MLIPSSRYPAQTAIDANYPQGKARNESVSGDTTGTPLEKDWVNDLWGMQQALIAAAGITPSGVPDSVAASDLLAAMKELFQPKVFSISQTGTFTTSSATYVDVTGFSLTIAGCIAGDVLKCTLTECMHCGATSSGGAAINVAGVGIIAECFDTTLSTTSKTFSCTGQCVVPSSGSVIVKVQGRGTTGSPNFVQDNGSQGIASILVVERFRQ